MKRATNKYAISGRDTRGTSNRCLSASFLGEILQFLLDESDGESSHFYLSQND